MRAHRLSILAICLAAGCAHGKSNDGAERAQSTRSEAKASREANVKEAEDKREARRGEGGENPERVEVPASRRRGEMASTGQALPEQGARGEQAPPPADTYGTDPANTRVNERDRESSALTPMDQSGEDADIEITQRIRKDVVADDSLSFSAKNVKIITRNGHVTLRGAVNSQQERATIEQAARNAAGPGKVTNELEVSKR